VIRTITLSVFLPLFILAHSAVHAQSFSTEELARRAIERRAVEAVIWGMPAVSYELMLQQMLTKTKAEVNQVVYWSRPVDWKNQTLTPNPDAIYFTFPKAQTLPVNGFWSLTLYNVHHFFEPNPIKRYSLGTKNKTLKLGPDGSLTIYVQAASPGADRESNWLPAPKGADFSLYGRAYWPKPAITDGSWTPPPVKRLE
jgi:hypothetical protein